MRYPAGAPHPGSPSVFSTKFTIVSKRCWQHQGLLLCHLLVSWVWRLVACLQAVELAVSRVAPSEQSRVPVRRLQTMRQTAAKAGSMVLGAGRFSAKVQAN